MWLNQNSFFFMAKLDINYLAFDNRFYIASVSEAEKALKRKLPHAQTR